MNSRRCPLTLPELGMGDEPITTSVWLAPVGSRVVEGDRVLEVIAGPVSVELPSPASGVLVEQLVEEDQPLHVGQTLGIVLKDIDG